MKTMEKKLKKIKMLLKDFYYGIKELNKNY